MTPVLPAGPGGCHRSVHLEYGLDEPVLRISKVGRKLYIEVGFIVLPGAWDVADEDRVRRSLAARLKELPCSTWLTVEMTTDPAMLG